MADPPGESSLAELLARSRELRARLATLRERSAKLAHEIEDAQRPEDVQRVEQRSQFTPPPVRDSPEPKDRPSS